MIAPTIQEKHEVFTICPESRDLWSGELFDRVVTAEQGAGLTGIPADTKIWCVAPVSESEMLFRTLDGRYYFSLCNGWGEKGSTLYGLEIGIYFDFGHPTTQESLADEYKNALGNYQTWGGAMAYHHRKVNA